MDSFTVTAYGAGLLAYVGFSIQLILRAGGSRRTRLLFIAASASALWEFTGLIFGLLPRDGVWLANQLADAARAAAWTIFLASLLPAAPDDTNLRPAPFRLYFGLALAAAVLLSLVSLLAFLQTQAGVPAGGAIVGVTFGFWVCASILGLVVCEQLFRATSEERRWGIKPLCLGLAGMFGFDLFLFSDGLLLRQLDHEVWSARGLVHALTIPLVMVATVRNLDWTIDVGVSRRVVFGSLALLLSGLYILAIAAVGYYVRTFGGSWGRAIQVAFLFAAIVVLALLFFSGTMRSRLRVFVSKHFFSYRYDYREEWLKFTSRLAAGHSELEISERVVQAFADLMESPAGALWLGEDEGVLRPAGQWNLRGVAHELERDSRLARFLAQTGWVIDLNERRLNLERYHDVSIPEWLDSLPEAWLVIPLRSGESLVGFVLLARPRTPVEVNWEVRDLLKTAASQAASFLSQVRTAEALAEARQFDAFNRMSAFIVHDLKNLVTQLMLMLKNAERHGSNPEFQRDMLNTINHVVERMNRLLLQLHSGAQPVDKPSLIELAALIRRARAFHGGNARAICIEAEAGLRALGHEDRLERVIGHLLQNAIDATSADGHIDIRAYRSGAEAVVEVSDNGKGMSSAFVRDHLFKPFHSSKAAGMGIGAYESKRYVDELGGRISVDSAEGQGTRVRVHLPAVSTDALVSTRQAAA